MTVGSLINAVELIKNNFFAEVYNFAKKIFFGSILLSIIVLSIFQIELNLHDYLIRHGNIEFVEPSLFVLTSLISIVMLIQLFKRTPDNRARQAIPSQPDKSLDFRYLTINFIDGFVDGFGKNSRELEIRTEYRLALH